MYTVTTVNVQPCVLVRKMKDFVEMDEKFKNYWIWQDQVRLPVTAATALQYTTETKLKLESWNSGSNLGFLLHFEYKSKSYSLGWWPKYQLWYSRTSHKSQDFELSYVFYWKQHLGSWIKITLYHYIPRLVSCMIGKMWLNQWALLWHVLHSGHSLKLTHLKLKLYVVTLT